MNISALLTTLIPIFFVLFLGYCAGKRHSFGSEQAEGLSKLALGYALPASLFVGMAGLAKSLLVQQWKLALLLIAVHPCLLFLAYALIRYCFGVDATRSILYGLVLSTSASPVFEVAVLAPLLGPTTIGAVGLVAFAVNIAVPCGVILLEVAQASKASPALSRTAGSKSPVAAGIRSGLQSPLLWAPVCGMMVVLLGWHLPIILRNSLSLIGTATSGVAVFAVGLTLAAHPIAFSASVWWGALGRITVQAGLLVLGCRLLHIAGLFPVETIICCVFPPATITVLLAAKYREAESQTASILLLSTLSLALTVPLALYFAK